MGTVSEDQSAQRRHAVRHPRGQRRRSRWISVRGVSLLALQTLALAGLGMRDVPLAAMLQLLACLVAYMDNLDRHLAPYVGPPAERNAPDARGDG